VNNLERKLERVGERLQPRTGGPHRGAVSPPAEVPVSTPAPAPAGARRSPRLEPPCRRADPAAPMATAPKRVRSSPSPLFSRASSPPTDRHRQCSAAVKRWFTEATSVKVR
jgi:hypothetical protein